MSDEPNEVKYTSLLDGMQISRDVQRVIQRRLREIAAELPNTHRRITIGRLTITWRRHA